MTDVAVKTKEPESQRLIAIEAIRHLRQKMGQLKHAYNHYKKRLLKNNPEKKAEGPIYYCYTAAIKNRPRVTVAGYVNLTTKELHYGVSITDSRDEFDKKVGRVRALGTAISKHPIHCKPAPITLKSLDHKYVREKMNKIAEQEYAAALIRQKHVR